MGPNLVKIMEKMSAGEGERERESGRERERERKIRFRFTLHNTFITDFNNDF